MPGLGVKQASWSKRPAGHSLRFGLIKPGSNSIGSWPAGNQGLNDRRSKIFQALIIQRTISIHGLNQQAGGWRPSRLPFRPRKQSRRLPPSHGTVRQAERATVGKQIVDDQHPEGLR